MIDPMSRQGGGVEPWANLRRTDSGGAPACGRKISLVSRIVDNGRLFPSPRLFAGRGRVRGAGD
jgi:hypothetical protein